MYTRRCLVVGNADDADPGFVGERLSALGYELVRVSREDADALATAAAEVAGVAGPSGAEGPSGAAEPSGAEGGTESAGGGAAPYALVVLLGSDWSVYDPANHTSVAAESALAQRMHAAATPVLGICYGAQLLAHALGGSVRRATSHGELGWYEVQTDDPELIPAGPWFQWHGDVFSVPPGAVELARSPVGPQAFWAGAATLAVQFHPEVDASIVARWAAGGKSDLDRHGVDAEQVLAQTQAQQLRTRAAAHRLVDEFLRRTHP